MALKNIGKGNNTPRNGRGNTRTEPEVKETETTGERMSQRERRRIEREAAEAEIRERRESAKERARRDRDELDKDAQNIRDSIGNIFGGTSSPTKALLLTSDYIKSFIESKTRNQKLKDYKFNVQVIEENVAVPSITISLIRKIDDIQYAFVHPILLVDYGVAPEALIEERIQGEVYRDTTTWADAYDKRYSEEITRKLNLELDTPVEEYINAGVTAIEYKDLPVDKLSTDKNYQSQDIDNLTISVMSVIESIRATEEEDTSRDVKPSALDANASIVASVSLTPSTSRKPNLLPTAEDFLIKISEVQDRNRRDRDYIKSLNDRRGIDSNRAYGHVSGRIDFVYDRPDHERTRNPRLEDSQCLVPEFIISSFDVMDVQPTLTLILQLVSSVGILDHGDEPLYLQAFEPRNVQNNPSRNLGGLAAELKNPETEERAERVQFKATDDPAKFRRFIRSAIKDKTSIALEVPSQGPLVGILSVFDLAVDYANGDNSKSHYNELIIEALDTLTDGAMSERWDPKDPVMQARRAVIPAGYWVDGSQVKRDSLEHGYVFYSNIDSPAEALDMAQEYDLSFHEPNQLIAANTRLKLVKDVLGSNFVQTDNVSRIYFDPEFFEEMLGALRDAKMDVEVEDTRYSGRGIESRRYDDNRFIDSRDLDKGYRRHTSRSRSGSRRDDYGRGRYGVNRSW